MTDRSPGVENIGNITPPAFTAEKGDPSSFGEPPPFYSLLVLLFWGWSTGSVTAGACIGLLLEVPRLISARRQFTLKEVRRIADGCTILFLGGTLWHLAVFPSSDGILRLVALLPLLLSPLILAQVFSKSGRTDIRAVSLFLRHQPSSAFSAPPMADLRYPYLMATLICASVSAPRSTVFYWIAGGLLFPVFLKAQSRISRQSAIRVGALFLALAIGYIGHHGLYRLQVYLEETGLEFFYQIQKNLPDPFESITAIGRVGELKRTHRIRLRVQTQKALIDPLLIRQAVYNRFQGRTWYTSERTFSFLDSQKDKTLFRLSHDSPSDRLGLAGSVIISGNLMDGRGLLPLPPGTSLVRFRDPIELLGNTLGSIKIINGPDFLEFSADYSGYRSGSFLEEDFFIPDAEKKAVTDLAERLSLSTIPPERALERIREFFSRKFTYTLLQSRPGGRSPVSRFLNETRNGHCEYFATASVLLLRAAGIPARYVTGWSVHEFNALENQYIARTRDAHAWASAWINGKWRDLDATPGQWVMEQEKAAPAWQLILDIWDMSHYAFLRWKYRHGPLPFGRLLMQLSPVILMMIAYMLWRRRNKKSSQGKRQKKISGEKGHAFLAKDHPLHPLLKVLTERVRPKSSGESLHEYFLSVSLMVSAETASNLLSLSYLYYKWRFDEYGVNHNGFGKKISELSDQIRNDVTG